MRKRTPARGHCQSIDSPADFQLMPKRIAFAAVDWYAATKRTTRRTDYEFGFDPFLKDVAACSDAEGCDMIVFSLWSHDIRTMGRLNQRRLFGSTSGIKTIILEVADPTCPFGRRA